MTLPSKVHLTPSITLVVIAELHDSCEDGKRGSLVNINTGTLCAAQFTVDDAWYRGRIGQVVGADSYEVMFVDYGNSEILPKQRYGV